MVDQFENCFVKVRLLQFVDGRCSMGNVVQVYGFVWLSKTCSNTNLQGFKNAKLTFLHFRTATFCIDIVVSSWIEIVLFPTASYEHQEFAFVQLKKTKEKRKKKHIHSFSQANEQVISLNTCEKNIETTFESKNQCTCNGRAQKCRPGKLHGLSREGAVEAGWSRIPCKEANRDAPASISPLFQ